MLRRGMPSSARCIEVVRPRLATSRILDSPLSDSLIGFASGRSQERVGRGGAGRESEMADEEGVVEGDERSDGGWDLAVLGAVARGNVSRERGGGSCSVFSGIIGDGDGETEGSRDVAGVCSEWSSLEENPVLASLEYELVSVLVVGTDIDLVSYGGAVVRIGEGGSVQSDLLFVLSFSGEVGGAVEDITGLARVVKILGVDWLRVGSLFGFPTLMSPETIKSLESQTQARA